MMGSTNRSGGEPKRMYPVSFLISLAVLAPDLIVFLGQGAIAQPQKGILGFLAYYGRLGVFFLPIFYPLHAEKGTEIAAAAGMAVCLLLYILCWIRYNRNGQDEQYRVLPFLGIPIPMAVFQLLYLALSAVVLRAVPMLVFTLVYAAGHIPLSWMKYRKIIRTAAQTGTQEK